MQLPQLDLILAWGFREWPVVWDRLAARGVRFPDAERAWERYRAGRPTDFQEATAERFAALYGVQPRRAGPAGRELRWPLALWPAYELVSAETPVLGVYEVGMRYREPPAVPRLEGPRTLEAAAAALRLGEYTEAEVEAALGPGDPDDGNGWSSEAYFYYDLADGQALRCRTVHGLLVEVDTLAARPPRLFEPGPASAAPRRRWWEFWKPAA